MGLSQTRVVTSPRLVWGFRQQSWQRGSPAWHPVSPLRDQGRARAYRVRGPNPTSLRCIPQGVKDMPWDKQDQVALPPGSPASPSAAAPRTGGGKGGEMLLGCRQALGSRRAGGSGKRSGKS